MLSFDTKENLISKRLILREIEKEDAELIVRWRSDPKVFVYFLTAKPITVSQHLKWYFESYSKDNNRKDWVAINKKNGVRIGVFGLKKILKEENTSEISYLLDPSEQGKGFASEALECLMEFARTSWNCRNIVAMIHKNNNNSIEFIKKLEFTQNAIDGDFLVYARDL